MKSNILPLVRLMVFAVLTTAMSACINPFIRSSREVKRIEDQKLFPTSSVPENQLPETKYEQKFSVTSFDTSTNTGEFSNQVFTKLNEENFTWLEETASKARKNKEIMKGGYWTIRTFYAGILPKNNTDDEYNQLFEKLNRWKSAYPQSITARVAIAEAWQHYAGEARGSGYGNTVTENGWRAYKERMQHSKEELSEAGKLTERCPFFYVSRLEIAKEEGWDFDDFEALYQEAIAFEPNFYYYCRLKAMYLLPRYSGKPGQFENYLEEVFREKGAIVYYLTLSHFILSVGEMPFDKRKYSWENAKQGFNELRQTSGVDKQKLNGFAKFSILANDFQTAKAIFNEIGEDWDGEVWHSKKMFDSYREITRIAGERVQ